MHRVVREPTSEQKMEITNGKWNGLALTRLLDLNFADLDDGLNVGVIRNVSENF